MKKLNLFLFVVALFSFSALQAATVTFTGGGDGTSWEDAANWDTGSVPGLADDVIIAGANMVTISQAGIAANTLRLNNMAQLTIAATGVFSLHQTTSNGDMIAMINTSKLIVYGGLTIINGSEDQIDTRNNSSVTNNGFINLIGAGGDPIEMFNNSQFINNGQLYAQVSNNEGIELEDSADFFNNGSIIISGNSGGEGVEMDDNSKFYNDGPLSISGVSGSDGICIDDSGTRFFNTSTITISVQSGSGEGIEIDDGKFFNQVGGTININGVMDEAIYMESGSNFDNDGTINLNVNVNGSNDNAIHLNADTRFRNFNIVNINMTANMGSNAIFLNNASSRFRNELCGVVNMLSQNRIETDPGSVLRNAGVLVSVFSGTHDNAGTINNVGSGTIVAPNGFAVAPNAVAGGGTITAVGAVPAQSACNINTGSIGCSGTTTYNATQDTYTQTANGCYYGPNFGTDEFTYSFQELCGNGEIVAHVSSFVGSGWGGLMMREDLTAGSRKVSLMSNQSQVVRREVRVSPNGPANPAQFPAYGYSWLRLVRNGNYFQGYISHDGNSWQFIMNSYVPMGNCIYIGLVSTNYHVNSTSTTIFDNVFFSSAPLATPDVSNIDIAFEEVTEETISVYPNPTDGKISIEMNSSRDELVEIRVLNALGQPVRNLDLNPSETFREEVDLTGLPAGMYYVHFQKADGEMQVERIILNASK